MGSPSPGAYPTERSERAELTRRALLQRGASGAAAAGLATLWAPSARASDGLGGTLPGELEPRSAELMLVNRLTHGWTEAEGARLTALGGFDAYRDELLYPSAPIDDSALQALFGIYQQYLDSTPADLYELPLGVAVGLMKALKNSEVLRGIASQDQAREKMMEFWRDHFSTHGDQEGQFLLQPTWLREHLRPYALDTFGNLLHQSARGAAMLVYLDQHVSGDPPNENYARELMELHTLGQNDPVTEDQNVFEPDVFAAAQALTGWSIDKQGGGDPTDPETYLDFLFKEHLHIGGDKQFLGVTIPEALTTGAEGEAVLDVLAAHSATAKFIGYKLARWLVRYDPPTQMTLDTANVYETQGGDIRAMMASLLTSSNLATAGQERYFLFRRPTEYAVALCRALGIDFPVDQYGVLGELQRMGNAPLEWPAPDGYAHDPNNWVGAIFARWEFANKLLADPDDPAFALDQLAGASVSNDDLEALAQPSQTVSDVTDRIDQVLTGGILTPNEKCVLTDYMEALFPIRDPHVVLREAFALGASCPSFQYR